MPIAVVKAIGPEAKVIKRTSLEDYVTDTSQA